MLSGDCLDPAFTHDDKIVLDIEAALDAGCYACLYCRPELVKPGRLAIALKRLVTPVPDHVRGFRTGSTPSQRSPKSSSLSSHNPPKRWVVECEWLLAVHRCIGRLTDPNVRAQLEAEGYRL